MQGSKLACVGAGHGPGGSRPRVWVTDLSTALYLYSTGQAAPHSTAQHRTLVRVEAKSGGCVSVLLGHAGPIDGLIPRHSLGMGVMLDGLRIWGWTTRLGLKHAAPSWLAGHSPVRWRRRIKGQSRGLLLDMMKRAAVPDKWWVRVEHGVFPTAIQRRPSSLDGRQPTAQERRREMRRAKDARRPPKPASRRSKAFSGANARWR